MKFFLSGFCLAYGIFLGHIVTLQAVTRESQVKLVQVETCCSTGESGSGSFYDDTTNFYNSAGAEN